jgi:transcriptional regulator with XRE-family HTH domain
MRQRKRQDNAALAAIVKSARTMHGLTLRELEEKIDQMEPSKGEAKVTVSHVTLFRLETGKVKPRARTLRVVALALALDPKLLFLAAA